MIASMIASVSGSMIANRRAPAGLRFDFKRAAQFLDSRAHHRHPDAAATDAIGFVAGREARLTDHVEQQSRDPPCRPRRARLSANARATAARSIPRAVVGDLEDHRLSDRGRG